MAVGFKNIFFSCEGGNQHYKARLRGVKIGKELIYQFKLI